MSEAKKDITFFLKEKYGIMPIVIKKIKDGVINDNYYVESNEKNKRYLLFKIYKYREQEQVIFELEVLKYLVARDFPCPKIIKNLKNKLYSVIEDKTCVLLDYIPGEMLSFINEKVLYDIGKLTGRLHSILAGYPQDVARDSWEPEDIEEYIKTKSNDIIKKDFPDAENFISFVAEEFKKIKFPKNLPQGITHQDIKPENIIMDEKGNISFIDFDNCYKGTLLYDLMTTVIWTCFRNSVLEIKLLESFVNGYEKERPLNNKEKENFYDALLFRLLRESFVWPMRWLEPQQAKENGKAFLLCFKDLKKNEEKYKSFINFLWKN